MPQRHDNAIALLQLQMRIVMADLTALKDAVAKEREVTASVIALLGDLTKRLNDAIASQDPAAIQAVVDDINSNSASLAAAVVANTPVGPIA